MTSEERAQRRAARKARRHARHTKHAAASGDSTATGTMATRPANGGAGTGITDTEAGTKK
jgi:hypothetical protein